jgi:hypothetical protein
MAYHRSRVRPRGQDSVDRTVEWGCCGVGMVTAQITTRPAVLQLASRLIGPAAAAWLNATLSRATLATAAESGWRLQVLLRSRTKRLVLVLLYCEFGATGDLVTSRCEAQAGLSQLRRDARRHRDRARAADRGVLRSPRTQHDSPRGVPGQGLPADPLAGKPPAPVCVRMTTANVIAFRPAEIGVKRSRRCVT